MMERGYVTDVCFGEEFYDIFNTFFFDQKGL